MRAQSVIALLMVTFAQLWPGHVRAADSNAAGRAYTVEVNNVARRVVLAELVKHPERIHRMSIKCTFQLDRLGRPHNVKVASNPHNRWADETGRRALAAAKFPPPPKGLDLANFDYQIDLDEPRNR